MIIKSNKGTAESTCKRTTIGGQALLEGLMMIGPEKKAMAVRKPDGDIVVEELPMNRWSGLANVPFARGSIRLFRQLVTGTKALLKSAEYMEDEISPDEEDSSDNPRKKQSALDRFLEKHSEIMLYLSAIVGILFSVVLFILLPGLLTDLLRDYVFRTESSAGGSSLALTAIEGVVRIVIFIAYLALASRMKDIKRVWMYHGAEHKTISCYEAREDLTVENARKHSRFHPRCGTAFMFTVLIVSIIVFAFMGWRNRWLNMLIRFLLVPLIAGIAYEIIRLTGRFDNWFTRAIAAPGLWLQRLTTAEPDDSMLEVAITAMKAVLPESDEKDNW